jgi:hypothetical protein
MSVDCPQCRYCKQAALTASKVYHAVLEDLEAAHISHNSEALMVLSARLESAFQGRNAAIVALTNHENTCAGKKPAEAPPFSKRQSA